MRTISQIGPQQCQLLGVSIIKHLLGERGLRARRYQAELNYLFGSHYG